MNLTCDLHIGDAPVDRYREEGGGKCVESVCVGTVKIPVGIRANG